jgi:hypothetical protein
MVDGKKQEVSKKQKAKCPAESSAALKSEKVSGGRAPLLILKHQFPKMKILTTYYSRYFQH